MLILTPNRRLAAFSNKAFNQSQAASKPAWEAQSALSIDAWLQGLWSKLMVLSPSDCKPVISKSAAKLLLKQIINESKHGAELLCLDQTVNSVIQAQSFLKLWDINILRLEPYTEFSADVMAFYQWTTRYNDWLQANEQLDFHSMLNNLIELLPDFISIIDPELVLLGVDEPAPLYQRLFDSLKELGISFTKQSLLKSESVASLVELAKPELELEAAACYAKRALREAEKDETAITIGIVVPELETKRNQVAQLFSDYVEESQLNISAPMPLSSFALIDAALLILKLARPSFSYEDLSILLRSSCLNITEAQAAANAHLDRQLRNVAGAKLDWQTLVKLVELEGTESNFDFKALAKLVIDRPRVANTLFWSSYIAKLLDSCYWPKCGKQPKEVLDLLSCWAAMLAEYQSLDPILGNHDYNQMLETLQKLAIDTPFLAAETGQTKVHVLGLLEADGLYFDKLWVTGMSQETWPPSCEPNPFIPLEIQRRYNLPKSSPERELSVATRLNANLQKSAAELVFSYSGTAVSNLLLHISRNQELVELNNNFEKAELEFYSDEFGEAIVDNELKGGSTALKLQAQCPFKAYAELRLNCAKLQTPRNIFNSLERGMIIHKVLELFWQQCESQSKLQAWYPELVPKVLEPIINTVLAEYEEKRPNIQGSNYLSLERDRIQTLVSDWLEYELKRESFKIAGLEKVQNLSLAGAKLRLRIDRLDHLEDNSQLIIDYKTGKPKLSDWLSSPILEPQLALYALANTERLSGVYIAYLREAEIRMIGLARDKIAELRDFWQETLTQTMNDYINAVAIVKPANPNICTQCSLQSFCRIYDK